MSSVPCAPAPSTMQYPFLSEALIKNLNRFYQKLRALWHRAVLRLFGTLRGGSWECPQSISLEWLSPCYIGRRISADSRISHRIVDPLSESRIRICHYPKIIGYQNRISDIRQSFVSTVRWLFSSFVQ